MRRQVTRRGRRRSGLARDLKLPLARWGFTVLAVLAICTGQPIAALVVGAAAAYAWKD